jgi:hypothetical protein
MRRSILLASGFAALLAAQQFQLNLDHLSAKSANTVDLSLNGQTLQFAARFLDSSDPDEARVKKMIAGLSGIYIKHFEFKQDGAWTQADLDRVRNQLKSPEWSRIIGVKSAEEGETDELYVHTENQKVTGVAILSAEPRELTVVNIVGPVDLDSLAELAGHLDIPKLEIPKNRRPK